MAASDDGGRQPLGDVSDDARATQLLADPAAAAYDALVARIVDRSGVALLLGAVDSGKSTLARRILAAAVDAGLAAVYVDTDLGQSTVGPPTTLGLRLVRTADDLQTLTRADLLHFVGDITPRTRVPSVVVGLARLLEASRGAARLVVVDTSGYIAGVGGQLLKLHKLDLTRPDHVVGLAHGAELEPLLGIARRFTSAEVSALPVHAGVVPTSVEQRAERRRARLAHWFSGSLQRYRVRSTAFAPALPPRYDAEALHGLLVGLDDGHGGCLGIGALEHAEGALRLVAPEHVGPPAGLRLGAVRVDETWRPRQVDLRTLLGSA